VIQFLLGFLIPLVAGKKKFKDELLFGKKFLRRDLKPGLEEIDEITEAVFHAIENEPCHVKAACKAGNLVYNMVGADKIKEYEG